MRCVIHDYSGHPFQVHLSRHLAMRGHEVFHLYNADHPGPKALFQRPDDPPSLTYQGVSLGRPSTHAAGTGAMGAGRVFRELAYGRKVAESIAKLKPDVVLCGNTPADSQRAIIRTCKASNIRFVYWLQDVYHVAVKTLLRKKLGGLGFAIGYHYQMLDRRQFRASDGVVAISHGFVPMIKPWVAGEVAVIENWGAIDDIPVRPKNNPWARQHGLHEQFNFIYNGTLGRKHNPDYLLNLAKKCAVGTGVIAASQGYGVPLLNDAKAADRFGQLRALTVLPLQPAEQLADVLGTADVLLATIEADAGMFAVPSKVLSYLCAGRPILLAAANSNLAAETVRRANAGIVVDPAD
jgi:colanic acid biosynthesis glycosyl transferase WcaI